MKLLIHGENILAVNPIDNGDYISANGAIFYKTAMNGWEIKDIDVPSDFKLNGYKLTADGFQVISNDVVPEEIDAVSAIIILEQNNLGVAYRTWAGSVERTSIEREIISRRGRWRRDNYLVNQAAESMGITKKQLDDMFIAAGKLSI